MARIAGCIEREIEALGDRVRIEPGKKHNKIYVDGKFIAILPLGGSFCDRAPKAALNIRAQIRRAARACPK